MSDLNIEKLTIEYRCGVTTTAPMIPRRYTLTHSDITGKLFLTIGLSFAFDQINAMRDEVFGEWIQKGDDYFYYVYLQVDGPFAPKDTSIRNDIFRRELPLAFEVIRYGDRIFFRTYPEFDHIPIIVFFLSKNLQFNRIENWGTFSDYNIIKS